MFLLFIVVAIIVAALWWARSERAVSFNERLYLKRRGYDVDQQSALGPPVSRNQRLLDLIESLEDLSPFARQRAAEDLSQMCLSGHKDPSMLGPLIAALEDSDATVRGAVAVALGNYGSADAIEPLRQAMNLDESIHVRACAQEALEKLEASRT